MKIPLNKISGFNKLPPFLRNNPRLALAVIFCLVVVLAFLLFAGSKETQKIKQSLDLIETKKTSGGDDKDVGVLVG